MSKATLISKFSFAFSAALLLVACNSAPAPRAISEVQPVNSGAQAVAANRAKASTAPGAVIAEKNLQSINQVEVTQPDGKPFKFADLKGKVVLVDVWATYCPPCREQAPKLAELNKKYSDKGFSVVGLNIDDEKDRDLVKMFMKEAGINYTVAYANETLSRAFLDGTEDETGAAPIPQLFVISREGKVVEHLIGNDPRHSIAQLEEVITRQLN